MLREDGAGHTEPQLRAGSIGWLRLASLGVSFVIAGHFSGWNLGLAYGGWGGLAIATAVAFFMYLALLFTLGTMVSLAPGAGGGATFVSLALGERWGTVASAAILLEYLAASAVIGLFVKAYVAALIGVDAYFVILIAFGIFAGLHVAGAGEALGVLLAMTMVSVLTLAIFWFVGAPQFSLDNLRGMSGSASEAWLPFGLAGAATAFPFATAFILAVEGVPMAAEEAAEPHRAVRSAMLAALAVLGISAGLTLTIAVGGTSSEALSTTNDPLMVALRSWRPGDTVVPLLINLGALVGLLACLFSVIYASSRQSFAMARDKVLPAPLARVSRRGVPVNAIIGVSLAGAGLSATGQTEGIFIVMVCSAAVSYLVMLAAFPMVERLSKDTGRAGPVVREWALALIAAAGSIALLASSFVSNPGWSAAALGIIVLLSAGRLLHRKRTLR
ncbi:amino acid permease [Sphingoaurantiacus capsulatus]|uniref:Amino acid permease n=1 Tax=Sphingoaurantiacus capsulatus TaxID=1771310 RepID=A0ABV7X9X6_9SPHN